MITQIGHEVTITEDFEIKEVLSENTLLVKEGDKGFIDSRGFVHHTTGQARGKISKFDDIEVKGYDHENIAKMIFKRLNNQFNLKEALDDYDVSEKDFIDEVEYLLSDIL